MVGVTYAVRGVYHVYRFRKEKERWRLAAARDCLIGFAFYAAMPLLFRMNLPISAELFFGTYIAFLAGITVFNKVKKRRLSEHVAAPLWGILAFVVLFLVLFVVAGIWSLF